MCALCKENGMNLFKTHGEISWSSLLFAILAIGALLLSTLLTLPDWAVAEELADLDLAAGLRGAALDVFIRFNPTNPSVMPGDVFAVEIQIAAGSQPLDGAEVHIDYDPLHLQVVDAAGNPASTIVGGSALDVPIQNWANNALGQIDYAAGTFGAPPSGTFVLATIRFRALTGTGAGSTPLTFVSRGGSPTSATYAGESVLTGVQNGSVTIAGDTGTVTPTATTGVATPTRTLTPSPTGGFPPIVFVDLDPLSRSVSMGAIFTMDIRVLAGSQPVDGVEVHLNFDPLYLQVVDGAGNPASEIEAGVGLDLSILNRVNNARGEIDFAAGTLGTPPSGRFVVATVRFQALWGTGGASIPVTFVTRGGSPTDVTHGGESVLAAAIDGSVTITGQTPPATPTRTQTATATQPPPGTPTLTPATSPTATGTPAGTRERLVFQKELFPAISYTAVEDTYLNLWAPNKAHGDEGILMLRSDGAHRLLLKFDVSQYIPPGAPVVDAKLYFWMYDSSSLDFTDADVYRVNRHWDEGTATWNQPWGAPGCEEMPADREGMSGSQVRLREPGQWVGCDVTALVQDWVSGSRSNEGVLVLPLPGQGHRVMYLRSSDWHTKDQRPKLEVEFIRLPPTPTPTITPTPTVSPMPSPTPTVTPLPGRIEGRVWYDVNGNATIDPGEPGLAGATLRLYDYRHMHPHPPLRPPVVTGPDGGFEFASVAPGSYVLVETNPPGYTSRTSDVLSIVVAKGSTSYANFGDQRIGALLPVVQHNLP
jgi:hypothetical protein